MIKTSIQYVVELNGSYHLYKSGVLEPIADLEKLKGNIWLVSDMQETIAKTMTVDVAVKYSEFLVRKKFRESGDFDEDVTVVSHWKKARSKNSTDVFVSAYPTRIANFFSDLNKEYEDHLLVFPLYEVLHQYLMHKAAKKPIAVILQHNRFADIVVGTKKKIFFANRCETYSAESGQNDEIWQTVEDELKAAEEANRIRVSECYVVNWIDSAPLPENPQDWEYQFQPVEAEDVALADAVHQISFFKALRTLTSANSISPRAEKTLFNAHKWSSILNMVFLLLVFLFAGGFFLLNMKTKQLEAATAVLQQNSAGIKVEQPLKVNAQELENAIQFIKELKLYKDAPSYKQVINELSSAVTTGMKLEGLKLDYQNAKLLLDVTGSIEAPFQLAQQGFDHFLAVMKGRDYTVMQNQFNTEIERSVFTLKLQKSVK